MATIIDAFVVTLGLDPKAFVEGQGQAAAAAEQGKDRIVAAGQASEAAHQAETETYEQGVKRRAAARGNEMREIGGVTVEVFKSVEARKEAERQDAEAMAQAAAKRNEARTAEKTHIGEVVEASALVRAEDEKRTASTETTHTQAREQAAKTSREFEARGKPVAEFFSKANTAALGFITTLVGASSLGGLLANRVGDVTKLGWDAKNANTDVRSLSAFRDAVERNGGSADAATESYKNIASEMAEYELHGRNNIMEGLARIGGNRGDTPEIISQKFTAYADANKGNTGEINRVGALLHYDQGSVNEMAKGTKQFNADLAESHRQGDVTPEQVEAMSRLNTAFHGVLETSDHLADSLLTKLAPHLSWFLDQIKEFEIAHPKEAAEAGLAVTAATVTAPWTVPAIIRAITALAASPVGVAGLAAGILLTPSDTASNDTLTKPTNDQTRAEGRRQMQRLVTKGYSPEEAAAMIAQPEAESTLNAHPKPGDSGLAIGSYQWHPDRQQHIAAHFGKSIDQMSLDEQVDAADWELKTYYPRVYADFKAANGAVAKAQILSRRFLSPRDADLQASSRGALAIRGLADFRQNLPLPQAGARMSAQHNNTNTSNSTRVTTGPITINTKATDAKGIATSLNNHLRNLATQADYGLA